MKKMKYFFRNTFDVRPHEWTSVSLLFLNLFLIVSCYYVCKSIRGALVIQKLGANFLPYIWILGVAGLFIFISVYSKLVDRFDRRKISIYTSLFFIFTLGIITYFIKVNSPWVTISFYIWGDIFSVVMIEQFWSLCNDVYRTSDAKRLYGLVGSGGLAGGLAGGGLVGMIVERLGTHAMPYVCMAMIFVMILSNHFVDKSVSGHALSPKNKEEEASSGLRNAPFWEGFAILKRNRLLLLIGLALVFMQVSSTLIDFQFNKTVEAQFSGLDQKSAFFGKFYFILNLVSLGVMLFVTSPFHKRYGAISGMLVHPIMTTLGLMMLILFPAPFLVLSLKLTDKSLGYSINRGSREVVYTHAERVEMYKAKAVIDMLGYRASKVFGSAIILPFIAYFPIAQLNFLNISITVAMMTTIFLIRGELAKSEPETQTMDYQLDAIKGVTS